MSALFYKQRRPSPVIYFSFDLAAVRKAFATLLGKTSGSWYQSLQKLLILLPDFGEQSCSADTMFPLLNMTTNLTAHLQTALAVLSKKIFTPNKRFPEYLFDQWHAAILLLSVFPPGWKSGVWGFDEESANQAGASVRGHTSLLVPEGAKIRNACSIKM